MREWYYILNEQQLGPIPESDLVSMFGDGQLSSETMVWTQEMQDWMQAGQLEGLVVTPSPILQDTLPANAQTSPVNANPVFLHIPIARLIIMSILSCGLYEIYWIYKNWKYLKVRDNLDIKPFWRGWFGIFYCHSLLKTIHEDTELTQVEEPNFSPSGLATGWVILLIVGNLVSRAPGDMASIISFLIPSFLCFVPVQIYINSVNAKINPNAPHSKWSAGHIVCLVFGLLVWTGTLMP